MNKHTTCGTHQREPRLPRERCDHCARMTLEHKIVMMTAKALIQKGYSIAVNDGEEVTTPFTGDLAVIEAALFTTDEDYLLTKKQGHINSFVRFIYGNDGWDVINDYGISLEPVMARINAYSDRQTPA